MKSHGEYLELLEVVKCVERGYQLSNRNGEHDYPHPLFKPKDGAVTAITSGFIY